MAHKYGQSIGRNLMHPEVTAAELVKDLPMILNVDQAAAALGVSVRQLKRWIASGRLQTLALSSRVQIPRPAIEALLARALEE